METFSRAPITEALLDIQAVLPEAVDTARLLAYHDLVKDRFPEKRDRLSWSQGFHWRVGQQPEVMPVAQKLEGYLFVSPDKTKIVQARVNGFTFNKLKPYETWEKLSQEAKGLWEQYRGLATPVNVSRVGLRCLNRIEIPLPVGDPKQFCLLFPDLPPEMPQAITEFFQRCVVRDSESGSLGVVTLTFEPYQQASTVLALILDIDVFYQFDATPPDTTQLWQKLDMLHDLKNRIFFSSLTENAKRLFR